MKKIILLFVLSISMSFCLMAQPVLTADQQGRADGVNLADYVINTFISPNLPPRQSFVQVIFDPGSTISYTDSQGNTHHVLGFTYDSVISDFLYNKAVTEYANGNPISDFYLTMINDLITQSGGSNPYYNGYLQGYNQRIQGINPVEAPPLNETSSLNLKQKID